MAGVFVISCSKDDDDDNIVKSTNSTNEIISQAQEVGLQHNIGLDSCYYMVSQSPFSDLVAARNLAYTSVTDFGHNYVDINYSIGSVSDSLYELIDSLSNDILNRVNSDEGLDLSFLNNNQKQFYYDLADILSDRDLSDAEFEDKLDELSQRCIASLQGDDLFQLLVGIEVGKKSYMYWKYDTKWSDLRNGADKSWFNWKELALSDAEGAISGGSHGGGFIGALIGGVAASAGDAVQQIVNHNI